MTFSEELKKVVEESKRQCYRIQEENVTVDAFILACLSVEDGCAAKSVINEKIDVTVLKEIIEDAYDVVETSVIQIDNLKLGKTLERILFTIPDLELQSGLFKDSDELSSLHILYCIVKEGTATVVKTLQNSEITEEFLRNKLKIKSTKKKEPEKKKTFLNTFCRNLNDLVDTFHPTIGRDEQIERMIQILGRKEKNNPIIIGEAGVGKTALIEGLTKRIVDGNVPEALKSAIIFDVDMNSIVSGTSLRGQFEKRMESIINEAKENKNYILFIDEIHTIIAAGSGEGSLDASNILKPHLSRGAIQCIGATTLKEYKKYIEKNSALDRRFQPVLVEETNKEQTIFILNRLKPIYENFHKIKYTDDCIEHCVSLSQRYLTSRVNPDKSIDILDEIGSRLKNSLTPELKKMKQDIEDITNEINIFKEKKDAERCKILNDKRNTISKLFQEKKIEYFSKHEATKKDAEEIVSTMTGIPITKISASEIDKLYESEKGLRDRIIGQDQAINAVIKAIKKNRVGFKDPNRPIGSFIFLGPTGVGKTRLAKEIADFLFDGENSLIRIDMSEYMEKFNVLRLVGAPPGYVGYEEGGQLTEKVRRKPYSVVLLDEIEKAHPEAFNIFLQVLDEGRLTDSEGKTVDFKNTIIIFTSNLGTSSIKEAIGFGNKTNDNIKAEINKEVSRFFPKEFLNRLDGIIIFDHLGKESLRKILDNELNDLIKNFKEVYPDYSIKLTDAAKDQLIEIGYDKQFGARNLKRKIEDSIGDVVSENILVNSNKKLIEIDFTDKFVSK